MDTATWVQILDETDCIALIPLGKEWIQLFSLQLWVNSSSSALVRQLVQEKENSEFKPVKLRLKIDLVSYPARAEGLGKYLYTHLQISSYMIMVPARYIFIKVPNYP